jgi:hypothetical protein
LGVNALVRRIISLSPARRVLLVAATAALAAAAIAVALLPFRRVTARIRHSAYPIASRPDQLRHVEDVRWAVTVCARRVPWRAKCLEQGLAAIWLLHRRAVPATLHYGLARDGAALAAHAWVRAGDLDVIGCENKADFTQIARFPGERSGAGPIIAQS